MGVSEGAGAIGLCGLPVEIWHESIGMPAYRPYFPLVLYKRLCNALTDSAIRSD